ncbi:MAG: TolC family outer membrane protein [Piscirickettsiaceae bacterium]|jgi:outer membrane protein|nr:TolC family outer membrane protein [Piscirickettsiaceae bacterium]
MAILSSSISHAENLVDVFESALVNDPQLLAEASAQRAIGELDAQATARFLPQLSLSANNGQIRRQASAQTFDGEQEYNNHGYSLSLTQPLFRQENYVQNNQADIAIEQAHANYQVAEQALILRVAERYFDFLARQDEVQFSTTEKEANGKQLEQVQQRFDLGLATITDLSESRAGYDLANANVITAENELANSRERLLETSGLYLEGLAALKSDTPLVRPEPELSEQWVEVALKQNPNLRVVRKSKEDAQQVIALEKSGHYPSLDLVGEKNYTSQSDSGFGGSSKVNQQSLSIQFNLPIYEGGGVSSRVRQASHRLDEAMQNEEAQRRAVVRQSRVAFNGVISGISRVKALNQALVSGQKALESTEAGYEVGTRTTVDVLNVRRDLFRAKRDYASSRYEYILSSLRLKQAAGNLSPLDLTQINEWLEEE